MATVTTKTMGIFTLAMINVAAILSLRNLPLMAVYGLSALSFYAFAALLFFIPSALVSAELATAWPSSGGVYTWVAEAFGVRTGTLAIWLQWVENLLWYPTILSFTVTTLSFLIWPDLLQHRFQVVFLMIAIYSLCTTVNFFGIEASSAMSRLGSLLGTLIPGALIIGLGVSWIFFGHNSQTPLTWQALLPQQNSLSALVILNGVILGFCGIEMSAVHVNNVAEPQKEYPRAIFVATLTILFFSILGSLAIAVVVKKADISFTGGVMQAFQQFFLAYHWSYLDRVLAFCILIGAVTMISTWIIGPSRGILYATEQGQLPAFLNKKNKAGMPVNVMILQFFIVALFIFFTLLMPSLNAFFWLTTTLSVQLYLLMYILLFAAGLYLRFIQPEKYRAYRIPGARNSGMWLVTVIGILTCVSCFLMGFIPPAEIDVGSVFLFETLLFLGLVGLITLPFVLPKSKNTLEKRGDL